jgi:VIT1/CCC1 family predicted Fe2+/Mn2+ transporter
MIASLAAVVAFVAGVFLGRRARLQEMAAELESVRSQIEQARGQMADLRARRQGIRL